MKRVIVTGGSGFIGINLIASLERKGVEVVNLDIAPSPNASQSRLWQRIDILDAEKLRAALASVRPDAVIHLAARTDLGGKSPADYLANTDGTRNVIDAANAAGSVERIVIASSRLVFDTGYVPSSTFNYHASTQYGRSKVAVERLTLAEGPGRAPCTIVRPTSIWGPWFGVPYRNFFLAISRGAYLHPRGHRMHKSMGYVGNVAFQIEQIAAAPLNQVAGKVFYVADYEPLEVRSWAEEIAASMAAPPIRDVPLPLLALIASGGSAAAILGLPAPLTRFRLHNLLADVIFDLESTRSLAGDCPFSVQDGIERTVEWLRSTGAIQQSAKS